jgi:sec-independent protein translocase protein TatC
MKNNIIAFQFSNLFLERNKSLFPELFFDEHIQEAWQRSFQSISFITSLILVCFLEIKPIVQILELPILEISFFQNSPGEFFISTLKIAFYTGLLFSIPMIISQIIFFLLPGLTYKEKNFILGLVLSSNILFIIGLNFSFFLLIPAALKFFISYGIEVIEPLWSFEEYIGFIIILFFSTGLVFQIPVMQVLLSLANILTGTQMLGCWKNILIFSTIISAVLTPSADPITQILLASAIFFLYLVGGFSSVWLKAI